VISAGNSQIWVRKCPFSCFFRVPKILTWIWLIGAHRDFWIFRFPGRIKFDVGFRRKQPILVRKCTFSCFPVPRKRTGVKGNPPKSGLFWYFPGRFGGFWWGKEPTPTTGELLINFDKIWRNRCFSCENRTGKCPKRPKMFFQILKGFPICFPIYCEPKLSARLKYYRVTQDRVQSGQVWSDFWIAPTFRLWSLRKSRVGQIRPVWGKLIQQTAQLLGRSVRILTGEPPKLNFRTRISRFPPDFWVSGARIFGFLGFQARIYNSCWICW